MKNPWLRGVPAAAAALVAASLVMPLSASAHAKTTLLETGSTLLYPLYQIWIPVYTRLHPGLQFTDGGTGSGTGIAEAESGDVQIGASDAYLPPHSISHTGARMLNIPLAISAQMVNYNLPGLNGTHLKLSGTVLAEIYSGKITKWNDKAIAAMNPGVKLPAKTIIPMRRSDASGDTFLFTTYLTDMNPKVWGSVGYGTSVSWPSLGSEVAETGNSGMVTGVHSTPYSVAYIGISYLKEIQADKLGEAMIENRSGKFVLPNAKTISAAATAMVPKTPADETLSLVFAPGANSYPIINYEYAIISTVQPNAATASAIRTFLDWAVTKGNAPAFLNKVGFQPLPKFVVQMSEKQITQIH